MSKEKIIHVCDGIIEWCFYLLLVAVTFSTSIVEIAAITMIFAWLVKKATDRDLKFFNLIPVRLITAVLLWTILSCFNSEYFNESFRGILKVLEYSLIFIIAATSLGKEAIVKRSFIVIIAAAVLACVNGIFQYFSGYDFIRHRELIKKDYLHRISSSFIHPNDFGVYLLVVSVIFIAFFLSQRNRLRNRFLLVVPLALSMVSLFLTKSRGAWISFSAAFLALGAMKAKRVLAAFIVILLVLFVMLPYTAQERIFSLTDFKEGTTWERIMLWKGTINMIKEHPILGFGANTYSRNFPKYRPPEYPDARYSHNSYLQMASEIGIVGAFLFLTFLVTALIYSLAGIRGMAVGMRRDLATGLFAGMVGFSFNCLVDTHLQSVNLAVLFHLLLGFCFALSYNAQKE
ncbi:MAG: O-antigen ligase family protein [Candidatus Omnitrophota bacterium]